MYRVVAVRAEKQQVRTVVIAPIAPSNYVMAMKYVEVVIPASLTFRTAFLD